MKRREEGVGLGQDAGEDGGMKTLVNGVDKKDFKWNDSFWTDMYNGAAKKFSNVKGEGVKVKDDDSSSSSSDSDSDSDEPAFKLKIIKAKRALFSRSEKSKGIKK